MISAAHLAQAYYELALEADNVDAVTDTFLAYLAKNKLMGLAPRIVKNVERMQTARENAETLSIISSHELDADMVADIKKAMGDSATAITQSVDTDLIGGFVAEQNGIRIDASLKTAVDTLTHTLIQ